MINDDNSGKKKKEIPDDLCEKKNAFGIHALDAKASIAKIEL